MVEKTGTNRPKPASRRAAAAKSAASTKQLRAACTEDTNITPTTSEAAAASNLPWPPRAPEWQSTNSCQIALKGRILDILHTLQNDGQPPQLQAQLSDLASDFNQGPSRFISAGQLPTPTPGTFTSSYIDPQAQQLIEQINATLKAWQANQALWSTALGQTHSRDALGRVTRSSEILLGQAQPDKQYQYDTAGRLIKASQGALSITWGYDANGNRTHENGTQIASYDSQDRLTAWRGNSYQYNAAGDLAQKTTAAGSSRYGYDNQGNLRSVTLPDGRAISYAIDPDNRRTGKSIDGQRQWQLVWQSQLRPIARLKADNTLEATFYYADKANVPEAMDKAGRTYRIVSDQLGSVRLVIDAETGDIAQQLDYDPWGNITLDTNPDFQPFGFAGGIYDPDTKLTRFGARDYDAETGRWTAKDPILFEGGDSNLYGYVLQDPVNWGDPEGRDRTIWDPGPGRSIRDGPRNGNWGGKNWSGGQSGGKLGNAPPLDSADECYMRHDQCYDSGAGKQSCDVRLIDELLNLPTDPEKWLKPPKKETKDDTVRFLNGAIFYFR